MKVNEALSGHARDIFLKKILILRMFHADCNSFGSNKWSDHAIILSESARYIQQQRTYILKALTCTLNRLLYCLLLVANTYAFKDLI